MQGPGVLYPYLVPACEIALIAIAIYYLLSFFWNTRAMDLDIRSWGLFYSSFCLPAGSTFPSSKA